MIGINESVNPIVIRLNGYRQFCELVSLLSFTIGLCGFLQLTGAPRWWWTVGALLAFMFFLGLAVYFARRAILEFKDGEFSITERHLRTLKAKRAPTDLMDCLKGLSRNQFRGEEKYFRHLSRTLTPARIEELKNIIFKHTYAGRMKLPAKGTQATQNLDPLKTS